MAAARKKASVAAKKKATTTARKPKPTVIARLERGEGEQSRSFWEISRSLGVIVTTRFGKHLSAGRTTTKEYETKKSAEAAISKAIAEKRAEGYSEPAPKAVIGGSSVKGVSTRNPELEVMIDEDPSDLQRYLIYADWLQQQNDPRGELILAQHRLETSTDTDELVSFDHIEEELFKEFGDELLGEVARYVRVRTAFGNSHRAFAWRCGFVRAARIQHYNARHSMGEIAKRLIMHPAGRFLEHVTVVSGNVKEVVDAIHDKLPKTFRTLAIIGNMWEPSRTLTSVAPLLPNLRELWLSGPFQQVGFDSADGLEVLEVAVASPEALVAMTKTHWPSLRRAHLTLSTIDDIDITDTLTKILRQMPMLEHLTLRRWLVGYDDKVQAQDALAQTIVSVLKVAAPASLKHVGLDVGVSKSGASALEPLIRDLPKALTLQMPKSAFPDAVTRALFSTDLKVVIGEEEPEERDRETINAFHHTRDV